MTSELVLVLTTAADAKAARQLAEKLVRERLAACVNLLPGMTSLYVWDGKLQEEQECQLLMKSTPDRLEKLESRLHELHDYDLPEFIVLPVREAGKAYEQWVFEQTETQP